MIYKAHKSTIMDMDTQKGIVVVGCNAFNVEDTHKDISLKGSFAKTLRENFDRLKWYKNHDQSELLGVTLEAKETETHLVTTGKININKSIGHDIYEDYKLHAEYGRNLEHSIGCKAIKRDPADKRKVSEYYLGEWSTLTKWGSNPQTEVFSVKSENTEDVPQLIMWLELSCKKGNYSDIYGKQLEDKIKELKALITEPPHAAEPEYTTLKQADNRRINALNELLTKLKT